jgi:hypothetical protein
VEFFKADGDEGRDLIGFDSYLAAEAQTVKAISLPIPSGLTLGADDVIVGTATDAQGNTSEFSFALIQSLGILSDAPDPSPAGTPYTVTVRVESSGTPFKPNGVVRVGDGRGGSCTAPLSATSTANRAEGSCELATTGAPGAVTLSASYSTFESAFATASGASIGSASATHTVSLAVEAISIVAGRNQYARVGAAFAEPLRVLASGTGGAPVSGVVIQFEAPSGPSATLSANTAITNASGIAEVSASANAQAGRYSVTARFGSLSQPIMLNNDSALGTRCTGARSSVLGFRDDFAGSAIDPARWNVDANEGSVIVGNGEATVSAGNVASFPYVTANGTPLPAGSTYSVRWVSTFIQAATHGTSTLAGSDGLPVDGLPGNNSRFGAGINGSVAGGGYGVVIPATPPTAFFEATPSLQRREVEVCYLGNRVEAWVDGVLAASRPRDLNLSLPNALFFGQFNRGLPISSWSNFRLDLVEVRALELDVVPNDTFELIAYTISAGGLRSAGGAVLRSNQQINGVSEFEIGGVVAQPVTGEATGGDFAVDSGFWQETDESNELLFRDGFETP